MIYGSIWATFILVVKRLGLRSGPCSALIPPTPPTSQHALVCILNHYLPFHQTAASLQVELRATVILSNFSRWSSFQKFMWCVLPETYGGRCIFNMIIIMESHLVVNVIDQCKKDLKVTFGKDQSIIILRHYAPYPYTSIRYPCTYIQNVPLAHCIGPIMKGSPVTH